MTRRILWNDLLRNKATTIILLFFILFSSVFTSIGFSMGASLLRSIDAMMEAAKTPHLLYMHSGEVNEERLIRFSGSQEAVEKMQITRMLNIDGADIRFGHQDLSTSVQDQGFVTQSEAFDFLLDTNSQVITARPGEVYIPFHYRSDYGLEEGDILTVAGIELTIMGVVRDSQMNSPLSSSKRFLVHEEDFQKLEAFGREEHLIAFRLDDASKAGELQQAYLQSGLESNGPPGITYALMRMINMISDGILIVLFLLIGLLILGITGICLRFSLLAQIEDDQKEIAIMRALGFSFGEIKKTYLLKSTFLALSAGIAGFLLARITEQPLLEAVLAPSGAQSASIRFLLGMVGSAIIILFTILYTLRVLRGIQKLQIVDALNNRDASAEKSARLHRRVKLSSGALLSPNQTFLFKEMLAELRYNKTLLIVLVIAFFLAAVPLGLSNTLSAESFLQNLGIGDADIRMEMHGASVSEEERQSVLELLQSDEEVVEFADYQNVLLDLLQEGAITQIHVSIGEHERFPVRYAAGAAPRSSGEIGLSLMNAEELGLSIGEWAELIIGGEKKGFLITGLYSDITSGGKTAQILPLDHSQPLLSTTVLVKLADSGHAGQKVEQLRAQYPGIKIIDVQEFRAQTFGSTESSVRTSSIVAIVMAAVISLLVSALFHRMMLAKKAKDMALSFALGFTQKELRERYTMNSLLLAGISILLGILLVLLLGDPLGSAILSMFGASSVRLEKNYLFLLLLLPALLIGAVYAATLLSLRNKGSTFIRKV